MDELGARIVRDEAEIAERRKKALWHEAEARRLFSEANEIARLLELARCAR